MDYSKYLQQDREKKLEAARLSYDFLILQHASLKCMLEQKYDILMDVNMSDKFISSI